MQAPGAPEEDTSGEFEFGGWTFPYDDSVAGEILLKQMTPPYDLLLGRKTYDIFAGYWPDHDDNPIGNVFNSTTKYVVSHREFDPSWDNSVIIAGDDIGQQIRSIKESDGPMLQVHGSSELIQTLLTEDLVDELWLKTFPVTLGKGKRLFDDGTIPVAWELVESHITSSGGIFANYRRAGEVQTGTVGD